MRRNFDRLAAPERFALGGGRLGKAAAVGVVQAAVCFDVGDPRTGVLPRQVEQGGIGQRHAKRASEEEAEEEAGAKPDGEAGHGWNVRGWVGEDKAELGGRTVDALGGVARPPRSAVSVRVIPYHLGRHP